MYWFYNDVGTYVFFFFFVCYHSSPFGALKMLRITTDIFSGREVIEVGSLGGKKDK